MIRLPSAVQERWLDPNFDLIGAVADTGNGLADLWEASPVRLDSNEPNTDKSSTFSFPAIPCFAVAGRIIVRRRARGRTGTSSKIYSLFCLVQWQRHGD
jgi:hypothetical protein